MFGAAFVVSLNVAVRFDDPGEERLYRIAPIGAYEVRAAPGPGQAISDTMPELTTQYLLQEAESELQQYNLDRLRTWSLVGVVGLAMASAIGGYVLSGMMLRPVRDITDVASEISATNLSRRINYEGPDDELKALADTFDSMIERLETSFERQRQFVQDASHELRTPLTAIRTNIEVAEMDPDMSGDEYRQLLDLIKAQTERLTRLSEDLLLLTRNEDEHPDLEPTDVTAVLAEVRRQLEPLAGSRSVALSVQESEPLYAMANSDFLYRCVVNLVDNAVKYSGNPGTDGIPADGPTASVNVSVERVGDEVVVSVADTGPGIAEEDQPRVFDRFYRVDRGRSRRQGGTGLGLAIVRELMEVQGGRVSLESAPGKGSTFRLHLPAAKQAAPLRYEPAKV